MLPLLPLLPFLVSFCRSVPPEFLRSFYCIETIPTPYTLNLIAASEISKLQEIVKDGDMTSLLGHRFCFWDLWQTQYIDLMLPCYPNRILRRRSWQRGVQIQKKLRISPKLNAQCDVASKGQSLTICYFLCVCGLGGLNQSEASSSVYTKIRLSEDKWFCTPYKIFILTSV